MKTGFILIVLGLMAGAAWPTTHRRSSHTAIGCVAVDGDTLNCNGERIRLNGIDAPEMPGHCRTGRACVAGNPYDSRNSLASLIDGRAIGIIPLKQDRYGRTVAEVYAGWDHDLSCEQLSRGQALYKRRWDEQGMLSSACPQ
jgi:micrococcal nuclease